MPHLEMPTAQRWSVKRVGFPSRRESLVALKRADFLSGKGRRAIPISQRALLILSCRRVKMIFVFARQAMVISRTPTITTGVNEFYITKLINEYLENYVMITRFLAQSEQNRASGRLYPFFRRQRPR